MALLLCHECYSWVEPRSGHCPDCLARADLNEADPAPPQLRATLGELTGKLGEVTVRRRPFSGPGLLYTTTQGLYFLPHHVNDITDEYGQNHDVGQTVIWSVAATLWAPLYLLMPLLRTSSRNGSTVSIYHPQLLSPDQSDLLSDLLMDNPGAFFVPSRAVRTVQQRWRGWVIERDHGTKLHLKPTSTRGNFDRRMQQLIKSPAWQHILT